MVLGHSRLGIKLLFEIWRSSSLPLMKKTDSPTLIISLQANWA